MALPASPLLRRISTVDALTQALRDQILDGRLPGGTSLREAEVSERYGVSRHSVRTSLQSLVHERLLDREPHRGATVRTLVSADVYDIYRMRAIIEQEAVSTLSGALGRLGYARRAVADLEATPSTAPWSVVRDADLQFHRALSEGLGSVRVSAAFDALLGELRLCFLQLRWDLEDHRARALEHRAILDAIEAGDSERARDLLRVHLDEGRDVIVRALGAG